MLSLEWFPLSGWALPVCCVHLEIEPPHGHSGEAFPYVITVVTKYKKTYPPTAARAKRSC